jgi:2-polyprenyl-3-methyl-5-hydroxy-6-metoxy-1,4-benzoquinol methylase
VKCKICNSDSNRIFNANVLGKYSVAYYQCSHCHFIQTETPYWLNEAYSTAISSLDVGLVYRNLGLAKQIDPILKNFFNYKARFLDFAGGYGLLVRLMRDQGFDFYRQDIYCENIFATSLDLKDLPENSKFEALTAFEVFEHLEMPLFEIRRMFEYSDTIIFSTELQIGTPLRSALDWWYFVPESGQHISFYTLKSLEIVAQKLNCNLYSNNSNLHILTRRKMKTDPFNGIQNPIKRPFIYRVLYRLLSMLDNSDPFLKAIQLESLLPRDFEMAKKNLCKKDLL